MIRFWIEKKNRSTLKATAIGVAGSFLLSVISPSFIAAKQSFVSARQSESKQAERADHILENYLENLEKLKKLLNRALLSSLSTARRQCWKFF